MRKYALNKEILDIPNARSSHNHPTPRGGGLPMAVLFITAVALFALAGVVPVRLAIALCGGGLLVAGIGWIDDKKQLSARLRIIIHFLAAVWSLCWLEGLPALNLGFTEFKLYWIGAFLATIGIVWMINLYNFMDGIDGIAGTETISVACAAGVFLFFNGFLPLAIVCGLLACSVAGFLVWNWPPAKIFMGDVGSGLLGFVFAVLAVASENSGALPLLVWWMLLGVFIVDATATLLRRIRRGERWTEAHRTHAYQLAVQAGYSHKQVAFAVIVLNVVLAGAAVVVSLWSRFLPVISVLVALVLIIVRAEVIRRCTYDRPSSLSPHM